MQEEHPMVDAAHSLDVETHGPAQANRFSMNVDLETRRPNLDLFTQEHV